MDEQIPYQAVCDLVFKPDLLPAVYRWVSSLSPEELLRFGSVFPPLAQSMQLPDVPAAPPRDSRYTTPEWRAFNAGDRAPKREVSVEQLLARPTSSHLTYGAFCEEEARACRAVPTRTRENEKSQILTSDRSSGYMDRWSERMLNTTYMRDICHTGNGRTVKDQTDEQTVIVCSKGTVNDAAAAHVKTYIARDAEWTRDFRELCRSLSEAIDATAYRGAFTSVKKASGERFVHPKWTDPVPVSRGLERPAESYWQTSNRSDYAPVKKPEETFKVANQHRSCYARPFAAHPKTEKNSTTTRDGFRDHMATRDEHPEYWNDSKVRVPLGSAVAGAVLGQAS